MKKTPIITVTCYRDLPLLDLQAQSINLYLDKDCPVYIIINEDNPGDWFKEFKKIEEYYKNHNLTIYKKNDFLNEWGYWNYNLETNPWSLGWQTQQTLKILISKKINFSRFLILDSQNFLIKNWNSEIFPDKDGRTPARRGIYVMPDSLINNYSKILGFCSTINKENMMSMCTPIFLRKDLCDNLIDSKGGEKNFVEWFSKELSIKSEFVLYYLWAEFQKSFESYHYYVNESDDWGNPYLRDCYDDHSFLKFLKNIGISQSLAWVSINHRAWGNMNDFQFLQLCQKLKDYNLFPNFSEYRKNYIDLKF